MLRRTAVLDASEKAEAANSRPKCQERLYLGWIPSAWTSDRAVVRAGRRGRSGRSGKLRIGGEEKQREEPWGSKKPHQSCKLLCFLPRQSEARRCAPKPASCAPTGWSGGSGRGVCGPGPEAQVRAGPWRAACWGSEWGRRPIWGAPERRGRLKGRGALWLPNCVWAGEGRGSGSAASQLPWFPRCPLSCDCGREPDGALREEVSLETFEVLSSCTPKLTFEVHSAVPPLSGELALNQRCIHRLGKKSSWAPERTAVVGFQIRRCLLKRLPLLFEAIPFLLVFHGLRQEDLFTN